MSRAKDTPDRQTGVILTSANRGLRLNRSLAW
jgi:hypothetical protein